MIKMIYLDHAASTPMEPKALELLKEAYGEDFANPSAAHKLGRKLFEKIEESRSLFLEILKARPQDQFLFTSSATESNNMVSQWVLNHFGREDRLLLSSADHPSLTVPLTLPKPNGPQIKEIPLLGNGQIHRERLVEIFQENPRRPPAVLAISHVNNHSGNWHPLKELCRDLKELNPSLHIHVDASQSFGKLPLSLQDATIDSLTLSAHKMGGPKGVGGLYLSSKVKIPPLLWGGGQEMGLRSSTQNAPLIHSWTSAALENSPQKMEESMARTTHLGTGLKNYLQAQLPEALFPFGPVPGEFSPYIFTFILPHVPSDIILRHLEEKNIITSSSAACSSRKKGPNPVFSALHIPPDLHQNVLRISFSKKTTMEEILEFGETLVMTLKDLRSLSQRR